MVNEWNNPKPQSRLIKRKKEKRNNQVASAIYKVQGKKEFIPRQSEKRLYSRLASSNEAFSDVTRYLYPILNAYKF